MSESNNFNNSSSFCYTHWKRLTFRIKQNVQTTFSHLFIVHLYIFLFLMPSIDATARKRKNKRAGRREPIDRSQEVKVLLKYIYVLVFLPVVCVFVHSLVTDPMIPYLIKTIWKRGKKKAMSYLDGEKEEYNFRGNDEEIESDDSEYETENYDQDYENEDEQTYSDDEDEIEEEIHNKRRKAMELMIKGNRGYPVGQY